MTNKQYDMTTTFFKAFSHPTRLKIIDRLKNEAELCVCHIYEDLNLEQSNVSQHLKILKNQGILTSRKVGLKVMYSIKHPEIIPIFDLAKKCIAKQLNEEYNLFKP